MTEDALDELIADGEPPAAAPRAPSADLLARLAAAPWDYGFYQAMRRLEALHRDRPRLGRSARPAPSADASAQVRADCHWRGLEFGHDQYAAARSRDLRRRGQR